MNTEASLAEVATAQHACADMRGGSSARIKTVATDPACSPRGGTDHSSRSQASFTQSSRSTGAYWFTPSFMDKYVHIRIFTTFWLSVGYCWHFKWTSCNRPSVHVTDIKRALCVSLTEAQLYPHPPPSAWFYNNCIDHITKNTLLSWITSGQGYTAVWTESQLVNTMEIFHH